VIAIRIFVVKFLAAYCCFWGVEQGSLIFGFLTINNSSMVYFRLKSFRVWCSRYNLVGRCQRCSFCNKGETSFYQNSEFEIALKARKRYGVLSLNCKLCGPKEYLTLKIYNQTKGQLISKCLFGAIVATKKPTKFL
jgi:hypothetical protein